MPDGGSQTINSPIVANSNGNNHVFKVEEFSKAISHAYCVMLVEVRNPCWRLAMEQAILIFQSVYNSTAQFQRLNPCFQSPRI